MDRLASELLEEFRADGALKELRGPDQRARGFAPIEEFQEGDLVFLGKLKLAAEAFSRKPTVAVISKEIADALDADPELAKAAESSSVLVSDNLTLSQAKLRQRYGDRDFEDDDWGRIHPSAVIHPKARVDDTAFVGPLAVIGKGAQIGPGARIMARAVVERDAKIGARTIVHPGAFIGFECEVGADSIIKSGAVIGSEGFGFAQDANRKHHRIPQMGKVVIGERCVIGGNCCLDRASYRETRIHDGVIFDNLVHIAHNVEIGEDSIILGQTGIAGSSKLGKRVILSGQSGVLDHLEVADDGVFLHRPAVLQNVKKGGVYAGWPLLPIQEYSRVQVLIKKLPELKRRVDELERRMGGREAK